MAERHRSYAQPPIAFRRRHTIMIANIETLVETGGMSRLEGLMID
jgi:hypothetical protein